MTLTAHTAGTIATRAAGLADFRALLQFEEAPASLPSCLPLPDDSFRHALVEEISPCGTRLEVRGRILALTANDLAGAMERVMRRVADAAAISGAVLEMRVLREQSPRSAPPDLVEALAVDLWRAGFRVGFAPCWEPAGPDGLALGASGAEKGLRGFLREHPVWRPS